MSLWPADLLRIEAVREMVVSSDAGYVLGNCMEEFPLHLVVEECRSVH